MDGLFKKFIEFAIGNGIVLILGVISSPIITRLVDPTEMGKFSMFTMVTSLVLLVTMLGIDQSFVRYYYEEEEENRGKLLRTSIKWPLIASLIVSLILIIFYKPLSVLISSKESIVIVILVIINVLFSVINQFSLLDVRMKQKAKYYSFLSVLLKLSNLIFAITFYFIFKDNYIILVLATVLSVMLVSMVAVYTERKEWFSFRKGTELKTSQKELINYGVPLIFALAVTWVFQSADKMTIKHFNGSAELGLYASAMTIVNILSAVQGAFTTFWTPVAYEKYSKNPEDKEFFVNINELVSVVMMILAIMLIAAKDIVVLLLGPKFRESVFIFPFLVFMPIMYTISETTVLGINFKRKTKDHIWIATVSAVSNIIGNLILVPKLGAKGAAISTGLAYIIFFAMRTYFSQKYYKVNYSLGKFAICTVLVYILAGVSSMYKFNLLILGLTIVCIAAVLLLYRDTISKFYKLAKHKLKKK